MLRTLRVLYFAFKTTLQTRLEYRADLLLGLLGALGGQAAGLSTLWVLLHQGGGSLAGWSPLQLGLLFGLTAAVQGTSELLYNHIWFTPVYVVRGQFDRLLCYPVPQLPFFLLTCPELHALGNIGGGTLLFTACLLKLGLPAWWLLALPWWCFWGSLMHSGLLTLAGSLILRVKGNAHQLLWMTNGLLANSRFPLGVYPLGLRVLLLVAIPVATANYLPVSLLLGRLPWWLGLGGPMLAGAATMGLAWWAWERSMLRYESSGS